LTAEATLDVCRQVYLLHNEKIVPLLLEDAVDGGNARSRAIFLGESVEEGLSAGLAQQVIARVVAKSALPTRSQN
jgi:hypothetical protein